VKERKAASAQKGLPQARVRAIVALGMIHRMPKHSSAEALRRLRGWFCVGALVVLPILGQAQRALSWRVFKAADGLSESESTAITVSPQGHVWVKHGEAEMISWLDGYMVHHIRSPGGRSTRVYESSSGQIWSLYTDGILEYQTNQWLHYPVAEIQTESQINPLRRAVHPISLWPTERDCVLFLLPDRLMEFQAASNQTRILRRLSESKLGQFEDMAGAQDGSVWIAGAQGLARCMGLSRTSVTALAWQEFHPPDDWQIRNFQRPVPDEEGGVTAVADTATNRVLVHFDGQAWESTQVLGGRIRQGWRGLDDCFWAQSINALSRVEPNNLEVPEREGPLAAQIYDVAVEPKGVFWLATSEGLYRHTPLLWRTPPREAAANSLVHAIHQDASNRLWFAGASALILLEGGNWQTFDYPEKIETQALGEPPAPNNLSNRVEKVEITFQPPDALFSLPDGRLAINATDHLLLFNPASRRFEGGRRGGERRRTLIGQFRDGSLCLQVPDVENPQTTYHLESFDGQEFRPYGPLRLNWGANGRLYTCYAATNRDLWLGGSAGVALLRDNRLQTFSRADGEPPDAAFCFLEIQEGKLWCGGLSQIFEFDGKNWSVARMGFDRVNGMIKSQKGLIWVASSDGLYRYVTNSWVLNAVEEGLPSSTVYAICQDHQHNQWAGTALGLSGYNASADIEPPKTLIASVNGQKDFPIDTPVTLSFRGQDKWKFTAAEHLLYSYRLDNYPWSAFTPENAATFRGVIPGKHQCEARAMDRNGNIDGPDPAAFEFSVIVPWYLERRLLWTTFGGLVVALFFAALAVNRHLQLKRSFAEVERIVAERTHQLEQANQALLHSQKMKALGTLAAGIAHDFNSILSIIKGSAQIIEGHLDDREKIRTRVDRITTAVDQGSGIVKAMLGFSRSTGKELALSDVNQVVEDASELMGDRFLQEIALYQELAPDLPRVLCAKELLQQMLLNLIVNASEAMGGHGQVTVRTGLMNALPPNPVLAPTETGRWVFIAVQDQGGGIAPELLTRVFEPFFTTKALSVRRGTGLGLSMVYEFAKDLGYGVHVQSEVGKGSTFTILIPVKEPSASGDISTSGAGGLARGN
jgi:signal transduction histidine kinase/ligand-binding sensor domain-containing protein